MTMKRKISDRASLIPILRPGSSLLSDTCNPQQAVGERNVGPETICDRSLSYLQLSSADYTKSEILIHILENIVIVSSGFEVVIEKLPEEEVLVELIIFRNEIY